MEGSPVVDFGTSGFFGPSGSLFNEDVFRKEEAVSMSSSFGGIRKRCSDFFLSLFWRRLPTGFLLAGVVVSGVVEKSVVVVGDEVVVSGISVVDVIVVIDSVVVGIRVVTEFSIIV